MTSSGTCHKCGIICNYFHYTEPHENGKHIGYWHCAEHGPLKIQSDSELTSTAISGESLSPNIGKSQMAGMNREERRYFKRTGKIRS